MTNGMNAIPADSTPTSSPSSTWDNRTIVNAATQTAQSPTALADLQGNELVNRISELMRSNNAEDRRQLIDLAMNNREARGVLSDLASNQGNQQTAQAANEVLKAVQANQNAKNGEGVNQRGMA